MQHKKIVELWVESWVSVMCSDSGDLWCSSDTSRCVAEKKYTEQQAKKLFPQVFVPVCNPDGTYSEVTKKHNINDEALVEKSNSFFLQE